MTPTLRTERLLLEPYTPADEEDFVALFQDERVSRWMGDGPASEAEDRALFGRIFTKVYPMNRFDVWAVRRDGRLVGHAEIKPATVVDGYEIIYALAAEAWGQGLGTELANAIVTYAFDSMALTEVHATVAEPNQASLTLLRKLGFHHVRNIKEDDGSTTCLLTRDMVEVEVVPEKVAWVLLRDGRVLVARNRGVDLFYFPGGMREPGESDAETLTREIAEELQSRIDTATMVHVGTFETQRESDGKTEFRMICYTAEYSGPLLAANEIAETDWFGYADRSRVSAVGQMVFDMLHSSGRPLL